jgi:hypothetical protein
MYRFHSTGLLFLGELGKRFTHKASNVRCRFLLFCALFLKGHPPSIASVVWLVSTKKCASTYPLGILYGINCIIVSAPKGFPVPWYKVTLPFEETGVYGRARSLQAAIEVLLMANKAPKDAAMFTNHDEDFVTCLFYFSPYAAIFAKSLIESYDGFNCARPKRAAVKLIVGHAGA